jgi:ribosomal protein S27AE
MKQLKCPLCSSEILPTWYPIGFWRYSCEHCGWVSWQWADSREEIELMFSGEDYIEQWKLIMELVIGKEKQ